MYKINFKEHQFTVMHGLVCRLICLLTAVRRGINMVQCIIKIRWRAIKMFLTHQSKTCSISASFAHLNNPRLISFLLQPAHFHSCHSRLVVPPNIMSEVIKSNASVTEVKNEISANQLRKIH